MILKEIAHSNIDLEALKVLMSNTKSISHSEVLHFCSGIQFNCSDCLISFIFYELNKSNQPFWHVTQQIFYFYASKCDKPWLTDYRRRHFIPSPDAQRFLKFPFWWWKIHMQWMFTYVLYMFYACIYEFQNLNITPHDSHKMQGININIYYDVHRPSLKISKHYLIYFCENVKCSFSNIPSIRRWKWRGFQHSHQFWTS